MERRKDSRGRNLRDGETQMPDGRYRFRYADRTGKRHAVYSWRLVPTDKIPAGKRECESLREQEKRITADLRDGIDAAAGRTTFEQLFNRYMDSRTDLKQSSRVGYLSAYRNNVADILGSRAVVSIRYSDVRGLYQYLVQERGLQYGTMEQVHAVVHSVLQLAVRDGIIRGNPSDNVLGEVVKANHLQTGKREALTIEQQARFLQFLADSPVYSGWGPFYVFLLGTGCRIGEAIGLTWKDIDFKAGTISINHAASYQEQEGGGVAWHIVKPKTKAGSRVIPMHREVRAALLQERRRQAEDGFCTTVIDGCSGFVFMNGRNTIQSGYNAGDALKRIIRDANEQERQQAAAEGREPVILPNFTCHHLRHTFCTRCIESGMDPKVLQVIMGHSSISITLNIYTDVSERMKQEAFEKLDIHVS